METSRQMTGVSSPLDTTPAHSPTRYQRARLGRTWQDRGWRKTFLGAAPSVTYWADDPDRTARRLADRSRH